VEGVLNIVVLVGLGAGIGAALAIAYLLWRCCFVHDDIIILRRLKIKHGEETAREMDPEWYTWVEKFAIGPSGIKPVKVKVVEEVVEEPEEEDPYAAISSKKPEPPPIPKAEMLPLDHAFQGWAAEWAALQVPHHVPEEDEAPRLAKGAPERLDSRGSEKSEVLIDIPALEDVPRLSLSLPADASLGREEVPLRALADAGGVLALEDGPRVSQRRSQISSGAPQQLSVAAQPASQGKLQLASPEQVVIPRPPHTSATVLENAASSGRVVDRRQFSIAVGSRVSGTTVGQAEALPPGWIEKTARSTGRVFYWNRVTNQTQYKRPLWPHELQTLR